jgi:hypothetical protein
MGGAMPGQGGGFITGGGGGLGGAQGPLGNQPPSEKRLRDLEKKLDRLLEQVESMRKERGRSSEDDPRQ